MPDIAKQVKFGEAINKLPLDTAVKDRLADAFYQQDQQAFKDKLLSIQEVPEPLLEAVWNARSSAFQGQQPDLTPISSFKIPGATQPPPTKPAAATAPTIGQDIEAGLKSGLASGGAKLMQMGQNLGRPFQAIYEFVGIPSNKPQQDAIISKIKQYAADTIKGHDGLATTIATGAGGAIPDLIRYSTTAILPLPPAAKMAIVEALTEADQGLGASIWSGLKGAAAGAGMSAGSGIADKFIQRFAQKSPALVKKIADALGGGAGLSASNQVTGAMEGNPADFKKFIRDTISGTVISGATPYLTSKILRTQPPPAAAPKVTVNNSNPTTAPSASPTQGPLQPAPNTITSQGRHPLAPLQPAPSPYRPTPVRPPIAKPGAPSNGTPVQPPLKPEVVQTAVVPASKASSGGKSRFNVSPEGEASDASIPKPQAQITGYVKPDPVEILSQPKALPPASSPEVAQLPAPTEKSAVASQELRGSTGLNVDKGVIYDLSALPAEELLAIRPVAKRAYDIAQDDATRSQAASRFNAVNFLLFNKAVAGEPGLESAQTYRDSHISTPEPVSAPAENATPIENPIEQVAIDAGGKVENGNILDETGVPTMKITEEPKVPKVSTPTGQAKKVDKPIPVANEPLMEAKPAVEAPKAAKAPTAPVAAAAPKQTEGITEVMPDAKMKVPVSGGSVTLAKGDTAYSHKGKVYVATPKGKDVVIENEDGNSTTVPLNGTVANTVAAHLGVQYKPASTTPPPPAKGAQVESKPVAKTTTQPPVQKKAEAKPKAAAAGAAAKPARTASIPNAKPAKATESASESAVPKANSASLDSEDPGERLVAIAHKLEGTELHEPYVKALSERLKADEEGTPYSRNKLSRFTELYKQAEKYIGAAKAKATGSVRAEKSGSSATVFDKDGNKIGQIELTGNGDSQKMRIADNDGKTREIRDFQDGQWNDKALSNISREIWK